MNTTNVTNSALVAGATILVLLWVCTRSAHSKRADKRSPKQLEGLRQIYPDERDANSEFDIIAIHGLDTTSDETWTWRDQNNKNLKIDWLKHPDMLRANFPKARIFTYDWPAQMFKSNCTIERTPKELARLLLQDVASRDAPKRQIVFIASCLGGLILIEALAAAAQSGKPHFKQVRNTTGGIIFLTTPFQRTSFKDIARAADPFLRARATLTATVITELLNNVEESTSHLQDLVSKFTEVYGRHGQHIQL
ncbi:hypothetical protein NUW58_g4179 [Xylaria curta]|uniref:Uncharacterized protein n=1 Tax=Xylaria curta TaxID=42375 RepID=A0ACC1P8R4_9PEZI|nr:hypothetical protein NUW58_g4179 [Xylaria curta]